MNTVSGPMFEPRGTDKYESIFGREGGHYNIFHIKPGQGMAFLREFFPEGEANEFNFVLFSTSGVHGSYVTIEECQGSLEENDVTFLVVQPRIVALRYGNCQPNSPDDFEFLKKLRASSWRVTQGIGL